MVVENIEDTMDSDEPSHWVDEQIAGFAKHRHMGEHSEWFTGNEAAVGTLNDADLARIKGAWQDRKKVLLNE